ncbi:hypothetical protein F5I97DRAFT_1509747 [Phlebopus sp. FC_14]|nr:hypothetical protein F5I97DRAFT_1509747 [Phlebopus sp. FC_14]
MQCSHPQDPDRLKQQPRLGRALTRAKKRVLEVFTLLRKYMYISEAKSLGVPTTAAFPWIERKRAYVCCAEKPYQVVRISANCDHSPSSSSRGTFPRRPMPEGHCQPSTVLTPVVVEQPQPLNNGGLLISPSLFHCPGSSWKGTFVRRFPVSAPTVLRTGADADTDMDPRVSQPYPRSNSLVIYMRHDPSGEYWSLSCQRIGRKNRASWFRKRLRVRRSLPKAGHTRGDIVSVIEAIVEMRGPVLIL